MLTIFLEYSIMWISSIFTGHLPIKNAPLAYSCVGKYIASLKCMLYITFCPCPIFFCRSGIISKFIIADVVSVMSN